jgi:single-strand DNA-binding protein
MKIQGAVKVKKDTQIVSDKFSKRELVLTTSDGQFNQDILIEFNNTQCSLLDAVNVNDNVEVDINLRGRSWVSPQGEEKYFNTIQGWKIQKI